MTTSSSTLCVIYTGGTIGMQHSPKGLVPHSHLLSQIQSLPGMQTSEIPPFDFIEYEPLLDSTDMQPADWVRIAQDIAQKHTDYAGFVVLHGTDTMAYTASALSFFLENLRKPVVVTGSQLPLAHTRSDGARNLLDALWVAAHYPIPEVTLMFNGVLLRGNRSTKVSAESFSAFASPNCEPLLQLGIHVQSTLSQTRRESQQHPVDGVCRAAFWKDHDIRVFPFFPGVSISTLKSMIEAAPDAIILQSFGSGNAPDSLELRQLLQTARQQRIPIINVSHCPHGCVNMGDYAAGSGLLSAGVIGAADMTLEAVITKLHYVLSNKHVLSNKPALNTDVPPSASTFEEQEAHLKYVAQAMRHPLRGELTPPGRGY